MRYVIVFLLSLLCLLPATSAEARINLLPQRIVFDARDRSAEITVLNMTDIPSAYRVTLVHYRQKNDGTYETLEAPLNTAFDPETMIRISPRQFQLAADGRQQIRLSLRKPADLPDGEYRFHLLVQNFDAVDANSNAMTDGVGVNLRMNVGVSIPVVVRHGTDLSATAKITQARYVPPVQGAEEPGGVRVNISRQGNISTIGAIHVYRGNERVGLLNNFNIFVETDERIVNVPLNHDPRGMGALRVVYLDDKDRVIDETNFTP